MSKFGEKQTNMPTRDEAPDECEYKTCTKMPNVALRYSNPREWVCYCDDHASEMYNDDTTNARFRKRIR